MTRMRKPKTMTKPCVFIGHGRSPLWRELKDFLEDELHLRTVHFKSKPPAGKTVVSILEGMLKQATFAVLILTAEDETSVKTRRARQNVIHEVGLFQGKLGFDKVVLLVQEGIEDFSNVHGLQNIRFSGDKISETFTELQRTLQGGGQLGGRLRKSMTKRRLVTSPPTRQTPVIASAHENILPKKESVSVWSGDSHERILEGGKESPTVPAGPFHTWTVPPADAKWVAHAWPTPEKDARDGRIIKIRTSLDIPTKVVTGSIRAHILGAVDNVVTVKINGIQRRRFEGFDKLFDYDIGGYVTPGNNTIEFDVANTPAGPRATPATNPMGLCYRIDCEFEYYDA